MPVTELYAFNLICENLLAALYGVALIGLRFDNLSQFLLLLYKQIISSNFPFVNTKWKKEQKLIIISAFEQ